MGKFEQRLAKFWQALAWIVDDGPRYANHFASDAPLAEIGEACRALQGIAPSSENLPTIEYFQSRLFELREALPAKSPYDPLDDDTPPHVNVYLSGLDEVLASFGALLDTFPRSQRDAARPHTDAPAVEREAWREPVERIEASIARSAEANEKLQAALRRDVKIASDNRIGAIAIPITVNIDTGLKAFATVFGDKWINVNWAELVRRNLQGLIRTLRTALGAGQAVVAAVRNIADTVFREADSLLTQSREFLGQFVTLAEDDAELEPRPTDDEPTRREEARAIEPEMVTLAAGSFRMGSPEGVGDYDEKPQHEVTIGYRFQIGRYPVTFDEYDRFAEATGRTKPGDRGWGRKRRPVIYVSWHDAKAYVAWLSEETGRDYRLPSEAEWEYACRAGTETAYSCGEDICDKDANFHQKVGKTTEVGSYPPNPWQLYDMHGNVWEWVEDVWHENYKDAPADGSAWTFDGDQNGRVLRGGSWDDHPRIVRSASRFRLGSGIRINFLGFRLARTLP
jgi:formylglycine-generating enzyme required for sulfatase activity